MARHIHTATISHLLTGERGDNRFAVVPAVMAIPRLTSP
jgi:hypothetical protein